MTNGGAVVSKNDVSRDANSTIIPNSFVDTHIEKTMEWGATAILSHSDYGIFNIRSSIGYSSGSNKSTTYEGKIGDGTLQVWNNSNNNYKTGYAATTKDGGNENQGATYSYNTENGIKSSTTGTVYGVYDMAGNCWEYLMGIYSADGINPTSNDYTPIWSEIKNRYYNLYKTTDANSSSLIGDLLNETSGWQQDNIGYVSSDWPIFTRGGRMENSTEAGIFAIGWCNGEYAGFSRSFRPVLIVV